MSQKLAKAAEVMAEHPAALQLRLLQIVVEVAAENNSTLALECMASFLSGGEKIPPSTRRSAWPRRVNGSVCGMNPRYAVCRPQGGSYTEASRPNVSAATSSPKSRNATS